MKKAIIITENRYPEGDAGAVRQHAFAKLLQRLGYDVLVIGYGNPTNGSVCVYDQIKYLSFRENRSGSLSRLLNRVGFGRMFYRYICKNYTDVDVIMVVDVMPDAFHKAVALKKRYGCNLIHDSVEWYSPEEFKNGKRNPAYIRKEYTNRHAINRQWNVIAISTYLEQHFLNRANIVKRIPVIMDLQGMECRIEPADCDKLRFVYAGGPGKKDYLREILEGFSMLNKVQRERVELHIYGVDRAQLTASCGVKTNVLEDLTDILTVHGRVSRREAMDAVRASDYSLLIRDETLRYAKAGFPTKIVESLACGTPPLCNLTSDLSLYLKDGVNAVIAQGHTAKDVQAAIARAIDNCDPAVRRSLRNNACKTAMEYFDYSNYASELKAVCGSGS